MSAIYSYGALHVYATSPRRSNPPVSVADALLTGERWLVPPVSLTRVAILSAPDVAPWQSLLRTCLRDHSFSLHDRAVMILLACDLLEARSPIAVPWTTPSLRRRAQLVADYFREKGAA